MMSRMCKLLSMAAMVLSGRGLMAQTTVSDELRVGIIGLDTSHVVAFTQAINNPQATGDVAALRVVAGFPGGTDIPPSRDRVLKFTEQLRQQGIRIVDSIPELLQQVDVVLLESVDGRPHRQQAQLVIETGKPLFIDKPVAGSLADAIAIYDMARQHNVPCFSSSSLRFAPEIIRYRQPDLAAQVKGCSTWGPCTIQPPMPDLFFYGVHGVETLFTIMGTGCHTVTRIGTADTDLVVGVWQDGRIGSFRGIRSGKAKFGATVFETGQLAHVEWTGGYQPLVEQIARFFRTGQPPVSAEETLELFAFMEAADESLRQGSVPVTLESVLAQGAGSGRQGGRVNRGRVNSHVFRPVHPSLASIHRPDAHPAKDPPAAGPCLPTHSVSRGIAS